jgi:hypothetical protein
MRGTPPGPADVVVKRRSITFMMDAGETRPVEMPVARKLAGPWYYCVGGYSR